MESTDNIYMDYIHHNTLDRSEGSDWTELNKNNAEASILPLMQSPILSLTHFPNITFTHNNITEYGESFLKIDSAFLGLFLVLPIVIATTTGFISGSAISKTNCCLSSIRGIIIIATTDFSPENLAHTLQNEPFFDQNIADYMMSATPNIMRGITTLSTLGFAVGSLWCNPEKQINLYQHVVAFIWMTITSPVVFYTIETLMSGGINNLQNLEAEQQIIALPLNNIV